MGCGMWEVLGCEVWGVGLLGCEVWGVRCEGSGVGYEV